MTESEGGVGGKKRKSARSNSGRNNTVSSTKANPAGPILLQKQGPIRIAAQSETVPGATPGEGTGDTGYIRTVARDGKINCKKYERKTDSANEAVLEDNILFSVGTDTTVNN